MHLDSRDKAMTYHQAHSTQATLNGHLFSLLCSQAVPQHSGWPSRLLRQVVRSILLTGGMVIIFGIASIAYGGIPFEDRVEPAECNGTDHDGADLEWDEDRADCVEGNAVKIGDTWYWTLGGGCPEKKCRYGYVYCVSVDGTDIKAYLAEDENGDTMYVAKEDTAGSNSQSNNETSASAGGKTMTASRASASKFSYANSGLGEEWDSSVQLRIGDESQDGAVIYAGNSVPMRIPYNGGNYGGGHGFRLTKVNSKFQINYDDGTYEYYNDSNNVRFSHFHD